MATKQRKPPTQAKMQIIRNIMTKMMRDAEITYLEEQFIATVTSANFWKVVKKLKGKQRERKIGSLKRETFHFKLKSLQQ